jgi:hypothetical protein
MPPKGKWHSAPIVELLTWVNPACSLLIATNTYSEKKLNLKSLLQNSFSINSLEGNDLKGKEYKWLAGEDK